MSHCLLFVKDRYIKLRVSLCYAIRKILNCNANNHGNQESIKSNISPQYTKIKVPYNSPATKFTAVKEKNALLLLLLLLLLTAIGLSPRGSGYFPCTQI